MQHKKLLLNVILLLCFGLTGLQAQESISTAGGNIAGSGGSVSYSVGQVVYTTGTGINGSVAHGVQQPYEISVVTGLEETNAINLSISVYPNPASDNLILSIDKFNNPGIYYQLYNINGMLMQDGSITDNQTKIDMSSFAPATYFVKVIKEDREIKTFKIIKN